MAPQFNLGPTVKPLGEQMGKKLGQGMEAVLPSIPAVEGATPTPDIKTFRGAMPAAAPAAPQPAAPLPAAAPPKEAPPTFPPAGGGVDMGAELTEAMPRTPTPGETSLPRRAPEEIPFSPPKSEAIPTLQREMLDKTRVKAAKAGSINAIDYHVNRFFERGEVPNTESLLSKMQFQVANELRDSAAMKDLVAQITGYLSNAGQDGGPRDVVYSSLLNSTLGADAPMFNLFFHHARVITGADAQVPAKTRDMYIDWKTGQHNRDVDLALNLEFGK
jgi:hypothetical protein